MVTLAKIAEESGFSIPVVSRALSPKPHKDTRMAEATRARIQEVARNLGYQPNRAAEFLKRGRNPVIGCFLPDIRDTLLARLMRGISEEADALGFPLSFHFDSSVQSYKKFLDKAKISKVCGIISYPYFKADDATLDLLDKYMASGGAMVLLEGGSEKWALDNLVSVSVDDYAGGRMAAEHLIAQGSGRCATLDFELIPERTRGFVEKMCAEGVSVKKFEMTGSNAVSDMFDGVKAELQTTAEGDSPYGVFLPRDIDAAAFINLAWNAGFVPGKDLLVVGFDDQHLSRFTRPALTTVAQPFEKVGRLAVRKLIDVIYDKKTDSELVKPELIVRDSA